MTRTWMSFAVVLVSTLVGCGPADEAVEPEVASEAPVSAMCTPCTELNGQICDVRFSTTTCCNPSGISSCTCRGTGPYWMCYLEAP